MSSGEKVSDRGKHQDDGGERRKESRRARRARRDSHNDPIGIIAGGRVR